MGPYSATELVDMQTLENKAEQGLEALDAMLLPVESALGDWPEVRLSPDSAFYLSKGQPVLVPNAPTAGRVRLYDQQHRFLGVGEILDDGRVAPRRLI